MSQLNAAINRIERNMSENGGQKEIRRLVIHECQKLRQDEQDALCAWALQEWSVNV